METLYRKVFIKSEADLPKEGNYDVHKITGEICSSYEYYAPKNDSTIISTGNKYY